MRIKKFPILYGQDVSKRIKTWLVIVQEYSQHAEIITTYGLETGRKIQTCREISSGKNMGKSNETSCFEQALSEARSRWKEKKEKDLYTEDLSNLSGNVLGFDSVPRPMLAHTFNDHKLKVSYPCYTQPKLDGYRAVYYKGKLYSRQGKEFNEEAVQHITDELRENKIDWVLDGELYHDKNDFNSLGLIRKKKLTKEDQTKKLEIKYHVYDIIDLNLKCTSRQQILQNMLNEISFMNIKEVETIEVESEKGMKEQHLLYTSQGYEGTMIRNKQSHYECKRRSYNLQKYKDFMDEEFEIVGYTKEQGGLVVWTCKTEDSKKFSIQSTGTKKERAVLYNEADKYIGKKLWVKFFEYTADGVPRFPKTMREGLKAIRLDVE